MDKDLTPSKTIWRVTLLPNSKKKFAYFPQKMFRTQIIFMGSKKSQVGVNLEILVGEKLDRSRKLFDWYNLNKLQQKQR